VIKGIGANVSNMSYLRDRTLAHWVGMNIVTESQVRRDWPDPPETDGTTLMGEREWHWKITVEDTPDPDVRLMEVEVRAREDDRQALTHLISYLVNAQPQVQTQP
jgi:general secretion pathway protein I